MSNFFKLKAHLYNNVYFSHFSFRLSACLIAILSVQICSTALPQSGAHEFDEFSAQEPQPVAPTAGKSSLTRNRVSNRAIASANAAIPRSNPQLKSHLVVIYVNKTLQNCINIFYPKISQSSQMNFYSPIRKLY